MKLANIVFIYVFLTITTNALLYLFFYPNPLPVGLYETAVNMTYVGDSEYSAPSSAFLSNGIGIRTETSSDLEGMSAYYKQKFDIISAILNILFGLYDLITGIGKLIILILHTFIPSEVWVVVENSGLLIIFQGLLTFGVVFAIANFT